MDRHRYFSQGSRLRVAAIGLLLVLLVGLLDYETGSQISLSVFYLLPISLVTWFTNVQMGILTAAVSALVWLVADLSPELAYSHALIPYWNAMVRLLVFLAVVFLESALKGRNQDLEKRVEERTALLAAEIVERRRVERRLEQYASRLRILHEIDQAILTAESLEEVVVSTIRRVQDIPPCDRVSFLLIEFDSQQATLFETPEQDGTTGSLERHIPLELFPGFYEELELRRQEGIRLIDDLDTVPLAPASMQVYQLQGYGSLLTVPVLAQGELIGYLNLISRERSIFSSEHMDIGREIADQLSIAIKQARMISQLRKDQENLQSLSISLLEVQEKQRRMIARELHDEIGQALTSIGLTLDLATESYSELAFEKLRLASTLVTELAEKVSQLSLDLRPALLDDLGLLPTLLWYLDRYALQMNIEPIFKHSGLENQRFPMQVETATFRIIQEALTNVARHAHVGEVKVTLWFDQDILGLQVEDEGRGFDPEQALSSGNSSGLLGMLERTRLLNGKLTIESHAETGTRVLAEFPVGTQGIEPGDST